MEFYGALWHSYPWPQLSNGFGVNLMDKSMKGGREMGYGCDLKLLKVVNAEEGFIWSINPKGT